MNSSPGWLSSNRPDGEITFVPRDVELVGDRRARVGEPAAQWFAGLRRQRGDFGFQFLDARFERGRVHRSDFAAAFVGFLGVERLRALRAVAVNGHALQAHLPRLHVGVADVLDRAFVGHVDRLRDGAADERLRGAHHLQMGQVLNAALAAIRLERAVKHRQMLGLQARCERSWPAVAPRLRSCRTSRCAR